MNFRKITLNIEPVLGEAIDPEAKVVAATLDVDEEEAHMSDDDWPN